MLRQLPDSDISLRDAADFILDSDFGRRALEWNALAGFPVLVRDLIGHIYRLTQSCHLPEFTDHGLPHLCSLVDRISRWTNAPQHGIGCGLMGIVSAEEAAVLLVATLVHDIGMLSQRSEDLPRDDPQRTAKALSNTANWVRRTHIARLEGLLFRIFTSTRHEPLLRHPVIERAIAVGKAHGIWPWERGFTLLPGRDAGLAAVLAVADLLDEDSLRCDTTTLMAHRRGTVSNMAHWIRHTLTADRVLVEAGRVPVVLVRPPGTDRLFAPLFSALRNHYRLVLLYEVPLRLLSATILGVDFSCPAGDVPSDEAVTLEAWDRVPEFSTQRALLFHLLQTFMPLALLDTLRESPGTLVRTTGLGMESIDLTWVRECVGVVEARSPYEQAYLALLDAESLLPV